MSSQNIENKNNNTNTLENVENEENQTLNSTYDPEKKTSISVTVIAAHDLPPMDHHGNSFLTI